MEKWNYMMINFDSFYKDNKEKVKSRARKGVPDCLRGIIWQYFGRVENYLEKNPGLYKSFLTEDIINSEDVNVILRDVDRTFPKNTLFQDKYGLGYIYINLSQRSLYNVLRAYSKYNNRTGYVQGMGFISALFLTYMDEEASFWLLNSLMENYKVEGYFLPRFPELRRSFYIFLSLLKKHVPKVYEHLLHKDRQISPSMYASQWFITLFSVNFRYEILVRVFDCFLCEGIKIIYRVALALMKINQDTILKARQLENVMEVFKRIYDVDCEQLLTVGFDFWICRKDLEVTKFFIKGT